MNWLMLSIPFVAGLLMAVQGTLNGLLGKIIGTWEGNFVVHAIATFLIFLLVLVIGIGDGDFGKWRQVPWYGYLGGIINVGIIYGVMASIPKLGASVATTAIIAGQLGTAMVIDWLGLFGMEKMSFSWLQIIGLILLVVGGRLMLGK
jgi:transporter family-2 protein